MKNNLPIILLSATAAFFMVMYIQTCNNPKPVVDNSAFDEQIADKEKTIQKLQAEITAIQALRSDEKKAYRVDSVASVRKATALQRSYTEQKAKIQELTDSLPEIQAFVTAADSLLAAQRARIDAEVAHRIRGEELHKIEIEVMAESLLNKTAVNVMLAERNQELVTQNDTLERKLARKKVGTRLLLGIVGGLVTAVTVMSVTN